MDAIQRTYSEVVASAASQTVASSAFVVSVPLARGFTFCEFSVDAGLWPTSLGEYLCDESLCCMIHSKAVFEKGVVGGCSDSKPGYHKSVVAANLRDGSAVKCFAQVGQLVLDRAVAMEAKGVKKKGFAPFGDTGVLARKYRNGLPIDVAAYGAGYCYLHGFTVGVRSRVARILGPLPLVADVIRIARLLGDEYVYAKWVVVRDGFFHVEPFPVSSSIAAGSFFVEGWRIVRKCPGARVGLKFSDLSLITYSLLSQCVDLWQGSGGERSPLLGCNDSVGGLSDSVGAVRGGQDLPSAVKIFCDTCGFLVNPIDHEQRCVVRDEGVVSDDVADELFARAWLGDVLHRQDVRFFVLYKSGVSKRSMGGLESDLVCRRHQALFYNDYRGDKAVARGVSERSFSTAFEASYFGEFRRTYIEMVFGGEFSSCVPEYARKFFLCECYGELKK